ASGCRSDMAATSSSSSKRLRRTAEESGGGDRMNAASSCSLRRRSTSSWLNASSTLGGVYRENPDCRYWKSRASCMSATSQAEATRATGSTALLPSTADLLVGRRQRPLIAMNRYGAMLTRRRGWRAKDDLEGIIGQAGGVMWSHLALACAALLLPAQALAGARERVA